MRRRMRGILSLVAVAPLLGGGEALARDPEPRGGQEAAATSNQAPPSKEFEARRAEFAREQKAKLEAGNAKAKAQMQTPRAGKSADPSPRLEAIREEARRMHDGLKTATPEERARMEKRAEELLKELERLGH